MDCKLSQLDFRSPLSTLLAPVFSWVRSAASLLLMIEGHKMKSWLWHIFGKVKRSQVAFIPWLFDQIFYKHCDAQKGKHAYKKLLLGGHHPLMNTADIGSGQCLVLGAQQQQEEGLPARSPMRFVVRSMWSTPIKSSSSHLCSRMTSSATKYEHWQGRA